MFSTLVTFLLKKADFVRGSWIQARMFLFENMLCKERVFLDFIVKIDLCLVAEATLGGSCVPCEARDTLRPPSKLWVLCLGAELGRSLLVVSFIL